MEDIVETEALPSVALYVLTNSRGINGAACMLYPRVLKEFAESLGEDLIILPSSIPRSASHSQQRLPSAGRTQ